MSLSPNTVPIEEWLTIAQHLDQARDAYNTDDPDEAFHWLFEAVAALYQKLEPASVKAARGAARDQPVTNGR